uniref:NACHT domain-containing protein n=2 Tax=Clytia hemisphaerica TaxID=252671 RepID=A0A7M5XI15_9CNID
MEIEILDVDEAPKPNTGHSQPPGGPPKPPEPNIQGQDVDEAPKPNIGHSQPPGGPPKPLEPNIQGQADHNPMYVLVYKPNPNPNPKNNPHCIFVKSVIDRHFHCLNSWGEHEPEPRVPINQAENQLWKIMLKYDRTPEGNGNVSRDDSSYINENKAKITSTSNTVMFNNGKSDKSTPASCCLEEVLDYISKKLTHEESKKLLKSLGIDDNGSQEEMSKKLENIAWFDLKKELEMIGKDDIIDHIKKKTLITKGLKTTSDRLRKHYDNELEDCLVEQPLSPYTEDTTSAKREDVYIDLVVLPSADVDKEWSNSDRAALIEQQKYQKREKSTKDINQILPSDNEAVFVRGVAGIGKTTLLDMFTYKWAKRELTNTASIEFMFHFSCRKLNIISNRFNSLEELFQLQYPDLNISFKDLKEISERVLIVIDGLDELKDLYLSENLSTSKTTNQIVFELLNPKGAWLPNHKVITCGRPKASEFVKKQLPKTRRKNIELCGFDDENIRKYIENFFGEQKDEAKKVQKRIEQSYDLQIMARVPVFLYSICSVYKEQLIKAPINTQTELTFFATLIFIKDHFNKKSKGYKTVRDIAGDKNVAKVLLCLMELSTTTYMQNKILFRQSEISLLNSPIPLEETGFLSKYSSNLLEPSFQFRHLFLQEFLTGLQICVTKDIKPFSGNVELSSCKPTILGIQRMLKMKENELFLLLYKNLEAIHQSRKPDSKAETAFTFDEFVGEFLKIPSSMIANNDTLFIKTFKNDCVEFLTLYKESRDNLIPTPFASAEIIVTGNYKDFLNIVNLINDLNIKNIDLLHVVEPKYSEHEKHLISLSALGDEYKTVIKIGRAKSFTCKQGELQIHSDPSSLKGIPDDMLKKSTLIDFKIFFEDKYNDDHVVDIVNFSRRLLVYNKRIKVPYIQVNGLNAHNIVTLINELKIKKTGELVVDDPKYSAHEKHLISLSALGKEFKTVIKIDENELHDLYFQCRRGDLDINVCSLSLAEIPDDLLTKSTSFDVSIGFEILEDCNMTDAINFLRRLSSYTKPITISDMYIESTDVLTIVKLILDNNFVITGSLHVYYPSYDKEEMRLITLSSLGEEFQTNIEIAMENEDCFNNKSYFECYSGYLTIVCHSVSCSLVDIPNELLQMSNSFRVSIEVEFQRTDDEYEETVDFLSDIIDFLRRLTSNNKPIVLEHWKCQINNDDYDDMKVWRWISHDEKTIRSILEGHNIDMTNINFQLKKK